MRCITENQDASRCRLGVLGAAALTAMAEITMPKPKARFAGMGDASEQVWPLTVKLTMLLCEESIVVRVFS